MRPQPIAPPPAAVGHRPVFKGGAVRPICALGVVAWLLFLSYRFASDAGETATRATLIGHGRIDGTLAFCLAVPGTIAALSLIAHFTARSETVFRALSLLSLLTAAAV